MTPNSGYAIVNPPKAFIALVALVCITVLMVTQRIPSEAGVGMLGLIIGYAVGNGIAARAGDDVQPIIGQRTTTPAMTSTERVQQAWRNAIADGATDTATPL